MAAASAFQIAPMTSNSVAPVLALAAQERRRNFSLAPLSFSDLSGFDQDDHLEAFRVFVCSCTAIATATPPLRRGTAPSVALHALARDALRKEIRSAGQARVFFETNFRPFRVLAKEATQGGGFLTGYYEPIAEGSLTPTADFTAPVLARPDNLNALTPYPDRAAIEAGAIEGHTKPLVFLRDRIEVFLAQVQGAARVRLPDGTVLRLVYAGRNGHPYTSIGRILIDSGEISEADMSLGAFKAWVRAQGQNPGDPGLALMHRNRSYVFFEIREESDASCGPIGGQGLSLFPLRSIAIDRRIWSYGLPFWIAADLPWQSAFVSPFRRLMVAQDTGSAIIGPARADIFFGCGDDAGARAGDVRHNGEVIVLLPAQEAPDP